MKHRTPSAKVIVILAALLVAASVVYAAAPEIPHSFAPGTPVRSDEINGNFSTLSTSMTKTSASLSALTLCGRTDTYGAIDAMLIRHGEIGASVCQEAFSDVCRETYIIKAFDARGEQVQAAPSQGVGIPCDAAVDYGNNSALIGVWACCGS